MKDIEKFILVFCIIFFLYSCIVIILFSINMEIKNTTDNFNDANRNIKYFDFNYTSVNLSDNINNLYDKSIIQINNFSLKK